MVETLLATTLHPDIAEAGCFLLGLLVLATILALMVSPFLLLICYIHSKLKTDPSEKDPKAPPQAAPERLSSLLISLLFSPILFALTDPSTLGRATGSSQASGLADFLLTLIAMFGPPVLIWGWPPSRENSFSWTRTGMLVLSGFCVYLWLARLT